MGLDKPITHYWGKTTSWPGATSFQTVDYSTDRGYNLIWGSHEATFDRVNTKGLGVPAVDPVFWEYEEGGLNDPAKKTIIDGKIATLNTYAVA